MTPPRNKASDWPRRLFVEQPDLYLPFLEARLPQAEEEVEILLGLFNEFGVPRNGKILDLACGIGRHSVLLAALGYEVVGVDISPTFIQKAKERAHLAGVEARFLEGDLRVPHRALSGDNPFDAVISMFTSIGYYGKTGDLRTFRSLRRVANEGATLVIETQHRDWLVGHFNPTGVQQAGDFEVHERRRLNLEESRLEAVWRLYQRVAYDLRLRLQFELHLRLYSLHELKELLGRARWRVVKAFGSSRSEAHRLELQPLTFDSQRMWIVAQAV